MTVYKIETGIPIPEKKSAGRRKLYPFADMNVGDSFFVPGAKRTSLRNLAWYFRPKKFFVSKDSKDGVDGLRVWRTE